MLKYIISIYLIVTSVLVYAQDFVALYEQTPSGTLNMGNVPAEIAQKVKQIKIRYVLVGRNDSSAYYYVSDTTHIAKNMQTLKRDAYYKNKKDKQVFVVNEKTSNNETTVYPLLSVKDWKITKSHINYLGYKAYKAETTMNGRNVIAYFIPQIPIPDGPERYCGLPGLIVQVNSGGSFITKLVSIQRKKVDTFDYPNTSDLTIMNEEQFKKNKKKGLETLNKNKK